MRTIFFAAVSLFCMLLTGDLLAQNSDIIANGSFPYPINIPYAIHQEASDIGPDVNSILVASFTLRDGGAASDADALSTEMTGITLDLGPNWQMIRLIELRNAADGAITVASILVTGQTVSWAGMSGVNVTAPDNGTINFGVRVSFMNTQALITDNTQFSITISAVTANPAGTAFGAGGVGATTSTAGDNNRIEVTATKTLFVQGPSNVVFNTSMSPAVTIQATDANNVRDLDNTSQISVTSTGTLTGTPVQLNAVAGLATFSTLTHTVAQVARTLSATAATPALTATGASTTFNVTVGTSNIILDGSFTHPSNIAYNTFQEGADIVNSATSTVVTKFILQDGGGASDPDVLPTVVTDLTLTLVNSAVIRRIALFDAAGTAQLSGVAEVVGGATAVFSGLTLSAADNGTTAFTVRASFQDPITDNLQFSATITSATAQTGNSQFAAANAGGAASSTATDDNRIEVTATKLNILQQPSTAFINSNMTPAVTIESLDGLDNRDLDNTSQVSVTSTGTLTGTPVQLNAVAGLATFSTLQHSVVGTGLTLSATAATPALTGVGPSSTFTIVGGSDIILNAFTTPSNIPYNNFQEGADIVSSVTSVIDAKFDLRDGSGFTDPDVTATNVTSLTIDLGPNFALIRRVALFNAAGTTQITGAGAEQAPNGLSQTVIFSPLTGLNAADGATLTFSIRASFMSPVTDNLQFSITITNSATGAGSPLAAANAGGASTPTAVDVNRIEVLATKLLFVQGPSNVDANLAMTPSVTIQAADPLNNRDLDNGSSIAVTSTGTLTGTPVTVVATSGLSTFPTLTHTVVQAGRTLSATATAPALTGIGPSATFNVTGTSNIIENAVFVYPTNIAYDAFQETNITVASPIVAKFDLQDGSGAADADATPTVLTNISFTLTNFANIRRMAIYDAAGTTELAEVAVASGTVTFGGLNISAADGGSTSFTVLASFNDPVTDNQQFQLTVNSATAQPGNSQFTVATAGAATTSTTGDINRIEVTATKLLYVQQPSNVFTVTSMTPSVTVESVDVLDNRDLDNTSSVAITSTGTLSGTPVTVAAIAGLTTFPSLTHTVAGTGLTLSATAAGPALTATGPSTTFYVSGGSDIIIDPGFLYIQNIDYATGPNQNNSITSSNGTTVATFIIRDGGGVTDPGATGTQLTDITIDFGPNWAMLKEAELWDVGLTGNPTGGTEKTVAAQTVTFTGLSGLGTLAADGLTVQLAVRVSFQQLVTDNVQISATITAATATGSVFAVADAGGATTSLAADNNRIEVIATKALYVQGASDVFVNTAMVPAVTVESVNAFNIRDLDNASTVAMTSNGTLSGTPVNVVAVNGLATFPALVLTATATNRTITATPSSPALTAAVSANFNIVLAGSDIITNTTFTYPTNIAYDTFQEGGNIVNSATSLVVAKFDLRDGSGTNDADALASTLTNLTLDLGPNFGLIRRIALFDAAGTTQLLGTSEFNVASQTIAFTGLSLVAADNNLITFSVRASFQDPVTDNLQFSLTVSAATSTGSTFSSANAGGATTSVAGDNNRIEVLATNLQFVADPTDAYINVPMAPSVTIQAADNLGNRDLDNVSSIAVTSTGTLLGSPVTVVAISGLSTFPGLAHSAAGAGLTLSATSTGPVLTPSGASVPFAIFGPSNTSDIIVNGGFIHPSNVAYNTFQESVNIVNSATSVVAAKFDIRDGGAAIDGDPFPTVMQNLTLDLGPNFAYIRRIALYDAAGTTELIGGVNEQTVASQFMGFSGLTLSAADGGTTSFTVRVSFTTAVVDNQQFSFTVSSTATQATNSSFAAINAGAASSSIAANDNKIEVTATKLLFVQGPTSTFANLNMAPAVTVESVDGFNNRDLDNTSTVSMNSTGTLTGSPINQVATLGLATFPTLQHAIAGAGLTLSARNRLHLRVSRCSRTRHQATSRKTAAHTSLAQQREQDGDEPFR